MKKFVAMCMMMVMAMGVLAGCGQTASATADDSNIVVPTDTAASYDYLLK